MGDFQRDPAEFKRIRVTRRVRLDAGGFERSGEDTASGVLEAVDFPDNRG